MTEPGPPVEGKNIERRIRVAAALAGAGLTVQLISMLIPHPLAFVAFVVLGCPLVGAGVLFFLGSLAKAGDG